MRLKIVAQLEHDQLTPSGLMVMTTTPPTRGVKPGLSSPQYEDRCPLPSRSECSVGGVETGLGIAGSALCRAHPQRDIDPAQRLTSAGAVEHTSAIF